MRSLRIASALVGLALVAPAAASAGTITGHVTDAISGTPLAGVTVGAGPMGYGLRDYATTGDDGSYAIDEPDDGTYNVCANPQAGTNFLRQCWHDATVGFYGEPITLPATGIDIALNPGTAVTGQVTDWGGQALVGVCVTVWTPSRDGSMRRAGDATTTPDGTYTVVGLDPGPQKVVFRPLHQADTGCQDGIDYPGFQTQWYERAATYESATAVVSARSETVAGVDGSLGTAATPPSDAVPQARKCVVPALHNRRFAVARARLAQAGCSTPMPRLVQSRSLARGRVIKSTPVAKQRIRRGRPVRLTVSLGPPTARRARG